MTPFVLFDWVGRRHSRLFGLSLSTIGGVKLTLDPKQDLEIQVGPIPGGQVNTTTCAEDVQSGELARCAMAQSVIFPLTYLSDRLLFHVRIELYANP